MSYIEKEALLQRIEASPLFSSFGEDGLFIREFVLELIQQRPAVNPEVQDIIILDLHKSLEKATHDANRYARKIKALKGEVDCTEKALIACYKARSALFTDTVKKMQEKLNNRVQDEFLYHGWYFTKTVIPEIVKEMFEDVN